MIKKLIYIIVLYLSIFPAFGADCTITTSSIPAEILTCLDGLTAGDTATINSGTYTDFPLSCITANGTSENWITVSGQSNRPVLDFDGFGFTDTGTQPTKDGSCTGGNVNWGVFTGIGRYIKYQNIEIINAHHSGGSMTAFVMHPDQGPIQITNVKATYNDSGFRNRSAGTTEHLESITTLTSCEFGYNGQLAGLSGHNIYACGGNFIVEYSWLHDPTTALNVHSRSSRMTVRYNLIESSSSSLYQMSDSREDTYGDVYTTQEHTFIGNIFIEKTGAFSKYFTIEEDQEHSFIQKLYLYYNTFIGYGTGSTISLVQWGSNTDSTAGAYLYNNIFYDWVGALCSQYSSDGDGSLVARYNIFHDDPAVDSGGNDVTIGSNCGSYTVSNNVLTSADQFVNYSGDDYNLTSGVAAIDAANDGLGSTPSYEYVSPMSYQERGSVNDLGAYNYLEGNTSGVNIN